jgi:hypothetical protein
VQESGPQQRDSRSIASRYNLENLWPAIFITLNGSVGELIKFLQGKEDGTGKRTRRFHAGLEKAAFYLTFLMSFACH